MIAVSMPHGTILFRGLAWHLTSLNASAAAFFMSTICFCRSIEYAAMVPFGWPPTLLLSVKVFDIVGSAPELIVDDGAEDIPVDVVPVPAVIEESLFRIRLGKNSHLVQLS